MDKHPTPAGDEPWEKVKPLTAEDVLRIETSLDVRLPDGLKSFLQQKRGEFDPDDTSVSSDVTEIIEQSKKYRAGFSKLSPWSQNWVYIGDESDACPYYIDCDTGQFVRLDKGNRLQEPLDEYRSFAEYLELRRRGKFEQKAEEEKETPTWKVCVGWCLLIAFGVFVFFAIFR